ncbi:unnamed protein product [Caretta caretta]
MNLRHLSPWLELAPSVLGAEGVNLPSAQLEEALWQILKSSPSLLQASEAAEDVCCWRASALHAVCMRYGNALGSRLCRELPCLPLNAPRRDGPIPAASFIWLRTDVLRVGRGNDLHHEGKET